MSINPRTYAESRDKLKFGELSIADNERQYFGGVSLFGKYVTDYSSEYATAQLWALEHFASATGVTDPKIGQLWFNTDDKILYVFGYLPARTTTWVPISTDPKSTKFGNGDVLPSLNGGYDIGSVLLRVNEVHTVGVVADSMFIRQTDGFVDVTEFLAIDSDEITYDGSGVVQNTTLSFALSTMFTGTSIGEEVVLTATQNIAPVKDTIYICDSATPIEITIDKMVASSKSGEIFTISNFGAGSLNIINGSGMFFNLNAFPQTLVGVTTAQFTVKSNDNGVTHAIVTGGWSDVI